MSVEKIGWFISEKKMMMETELFGKKPSHKKWKKNVLTQKKKSTEKIMKEKIKGKGKGK